MKEYPILFSTPMVRAILMSNKTMTRRSVPPRTLAMLNAYLFTDIAKPFPDGFLPYKIEDQLWVREEHKLTIIDESVICEFKDGCVFVKHFKTLSPNTVTRIKKRKTLGKFQRARFLPKEFARIWLEVTNVKIERLHDISEDDARAEGVLLHERGVKWLNYVDQKAGITQAIFNCNTAKRSFLSLWQNINNCGNIYRVNPWVWAISFKVIPNPIRPE